MLKRVTLLFAAVLLISQPALMGQELTPALDLYQQEKYGEAEDALRGILNSGGRIKNADEIYYWLGMIKYRLDAFESAKELFQQSLDESSRSPYAHAGLGLMLMREEKYTEATSHLTDAIEYSKNKIPEVSFAVAEAYLQGGSPEQEEAKKILYGRRTADPDDPRTYIMLGEFYKTQGVPELAIEELNNAIRKDPTYVPAYVGLAELYYDRGKETASGEDFQQGYEMANKAIELNPNFAPAYRVRAELYLISAAPNRFELARNDIEKYLELAGNDLRAKVRYVQFLFLTEDYEGVLNEMAAIDTTTSSLRRLKGMSLAEMGQYEEAQAAMDDYFSNIDKQYTIASDYKVYGDILRRKGDLEAADDYYLEAMSMKPADYKELYDDLAESYKTAAKQIEADAREIRNQAKEQQSLAREYFDGANERAREGDAAGRDSLKSLMDAAVEQGKEMIAQADQVEDGALLQYSTEAYYRAQALTYADPVTLSHHKDLAIAHYNAEEWKEADEAFIEMSKLKADYMLPYTYRFRIAYYLEQENPETNDWIAKKVSDDVVAAYESVDLSSLSEGDQRTILLAYEVQALYAFDPEGDDENYDCDAARPWINKIVEINPDYDRIKPVKDYCDQVQGVASDNN